MRPTPRPEVYPLYWRFASRRMEIFYKRRQGQPAPWTEDPILREYKFCNVYRALDRESQYLIKEIAYGQANDLDKIFQIIAFRFFSRSQTWEGLKAYLGRAPSLGDLENGALEKALETVAAQNGKLYTGAFILCATDAYGRDRKYKNHCALWRKMFVEDGLAEKILKVESFEILYEQLKTYPLVGPFMAYQLAIDLNYSPLVNFDENDFTVPGPGALRGIKKAFMDTGGLAPDAVVHWMVAHQREEFEKIGVDWKGLYGRPLHAIDCQNLFCEFDKYCRVAVPSLASARSRIKSHYRPLAGPLSEVFLPPKWDVVIPPVL